MKARFMYVWGVLLFSLFLTITSCTKNEDKPDPLDPVNPTISLGTGAGFISSGAVIPIGTTFKVNIIAAKGSEDITEVGVFENVSADKIDPSRLTINGSTATANPIVVNASDADTLNWVIEIVASNEIDILNYIFQVQSADSLIASVSISVFTVSPVTTAMGIIFNASGPDQGGFDFSAGTSVTFDSPNAYIRDLGIDLGQLPATNWYQQIEPVNDAVLRKATEKDYFDNIIGVEEILYIYAESGADLVVSPKIEPGDIYFVRKDHDIYMIRFTEVIVTPGDNLDNYKIDIKW